MIADPRQRRALIWVVGTGAVTVLITSLLHIALGRDGLSVQQTWLALVGTPERPFHALIVGVRIPRAIGAVAAGAALGLAGALLQTVMRNPLAEPGLMGVSGGAALGVVLGLFTALALPGGIVSNAVVGAIAAPLTILLITGRRVATPSILALAGILIGSLLSALTSGILLMRGQNLGVVLRWIIGSLNPVTWSEIRLAVPIIVLGLIGATALVRPASALRLCELPARAIGAQIGRTRVAALVIAVVLTAGGVLIAGALPFVGLVGGHLARRLVGSAPSALFPAAALIGALLLVTADLLAMRTTLSLPWADAEVTGLPVGALIAPLSAPYLIMLIRKRAT